MQGLVFNPAQTHGCAASAQQVCAGAFTGLGENGNQDLDPDLQMFID